MSHAVITDILGRRTEAKTVDALIEKDRFINIRVRPQGVLDQWLSAQPMKYRSQRVRIAIAREMLIDLLAGGDLTEEEIHTLKMDLTSELGLPLNFIDTLYAQD